jgi:hypothetical protein
MVKAVGGVDCVVCLETLSYIENWQRVIKDFSTLGKFVLIKLSIPYDPIGYVKNGDVLMSVFKKHYDIVEHIEFINRKMIILFGKSKLIGEL